MGPEMNRGNLSVTVLSLDASLPICDVREFQVMVFIVQPLSDVVVSFLKCCLDPVLRPWLKVNQFSFIGR